MPAFYQMTNGVMTAPNSGRQSSCPRFLFFLCSYIRPGGSASPGSTAARNDRPRREPRHVRASAPPRSMNTCFPPEALAAGARPRWPRGAPAGRPGDRLCRARAALAVATGSAVARQHVCGGDCRRDAATRHDKGRASAFAVHPLGGGRARFRWGMKFCDGEQWRSGFATSRTALALENARGAQSRRPLAILEFGHRALRACGPTGVCPLPPAARRGGGEAPQRLPYCRPRWA